MKPSKVIGATEGLALLAATAGDLASTSDPALPAPRPIVAVLGFYGLLGLVAGFGDGPARVAAAAGVVTLLASIAIGPAGKHLVALLEAGAEL